MYPELPPDRDRTLSAFTGCAQPLAGKAKVNSLIVCACLPGGEPPVAAQPLSVAPDDPGIEPPFAEAESEAESATTAGEPDEARQPLDVPPYVTVVLPCFNEQDHVLLEIERISDALDASGYTYELLAIDDKSTDQTLARLRDAEEKYPRLRVMAFRRNGGSTGR